MLIAHSAAVGAAAGDDSSGSDVDASELGELIESEEDRDIFFRKAFTAMDVLRVRD